MVTYNPLTNLYKVFGRCLTEKRAKRDGRNPATGAFSANTQTGAVDLTVDIPMVKGTRNLNLPDKTGYSKKVNSPDYISNDFRDKVTFNFTPDTVTHENSTLSIADKYGNSINLVYETIYQNAYIFSLDDDRFICSPDYPNSIFIASGELVYEYCNLRRNTSGNLLVSGRIQNSENFVSDIDLGIKFPEFTM